MTDFSPRTQVGRAFLGNPSAVEQAILAMASMFDRPIAEARVSLAPESADAINVSVQAVDRRDDEWAGRWVMIVWISTTNGGAPGGTQTVAATAGTVLATLIANQAYLVLSNDQGTFKMDVTIAGAATRYVHACVLGASRSGKTVTWAA